MRLSDLNPQWDRTGGAGISMPGPDPCVECHGIAGGCSHCHNTGREYIPAPERVGIGVSFDCPCAMHQAQYVAGMDEREKWYTRCHIPFSNPLDGGEPLHGTAWLREGNTFENLTLSPSIQRLDIGTNACTWHGFIRNGEIIHV